MKQHTYKEKGRTRIYICDCIFKQREGDPVIFDIAEDGSAIIQMEGYTILPNEEVKDA